MARYEVKFRYRRGESNSWSNSSSIVNLGYPDKEIAENNLKAKLGGSAEIQILDMREVR